MSRRKGWVMTPEHAAHAAIFPPNFPYTCGAHSETNGGGCCNCCWSPDSDKPRDLRTCVGCDNITPAELMVTCPDGNGQWCPACSAEYIVTRRSGFMLETDKMTEAGPKAGFNFSVDVYPGSGARDLFLVEGGAL